MGKLGRGGVAAVFVRWASGLRFPWLFALTTALFVLNVLVPDTLPLADELLLGLGALLLSRLRKRPEEKAGDGGEVEQTGTALRAEQDPPGD